MRSHLSVSIQGLLREINSKKPWKKRDEFCKAFWVDNYYEACKCIDEYMRKGRTCFTSWDCDNVQSDWSCWGHKE